MTGETNAILAVSPQLINIVLTYSSFVVAGLIGVRVFVKGAFEKDEHHG